MADKASGISKRAARWILVLSVLGLAVALVLVMVARRQTPRHTPRATRSGSRSDVRDKRNAPATQRRRASQASRRIARTGRVDRRRLAALLGWKPGHPPSPGEMGSGRGSSRSGGGPPVDGDSPTVFPLTAKGIRGAIRERIAEIKECYDGWLASDDTLEGQLTLAFTIEADPDGDLARISRAQIQSSTLEHRGLERCVLVMAESLLFEAPSGGAVTVRYPLRFRRE